MTSIELLFREYRRGENIKYEEFIAAGWTEKEYFEYLGKCEIIRSGLVLLGGYGSITKTIKSNTSLELGRLRDIIINARNGLMGWLNKYFSTDITEFEIGIDLFATLYSMPSNYGIYDTSDVFRGRFENVLSIRLLEDYDSIFPDEYSSFFDEELEEEIKRINRDINKNEIPEAPDYNCYGDLQRWAEQMYEYNRINDSYSWIDDIQEELERRKRIFDVQNDILFIYSGTMKCLNEHASDIESVTANITCYDETEIIMNINYCPRCNYYFLRQSEYDYYKNKYGSLPIRMQYIDGNNYAGDFNKRNEYSFLSLAGYSVRQKDGLSESERQNILVNLLYNGVSKFEIIKYLSMLVETNGSSSRMYSARDKWKQDLKFVRNYKIDEQRKKEIRKIKFGKLELKK